MCPFIGSFSIARALRPTKNGICISIRVWDKTEPHKKHRWQRVSNIYIHTIEPPLFCASQDAHVPSVLSSIMVWLIDAVCCVCVAACHDVYVVFDIALLYSSLLNLFCPLYYDLLLLYLGGLIKVFLLFIWSIDSLRFWYWNFETLH